MRYLGEGSEATCRPIQELTQINQTKYCTRATVTQLSKDRIKYKSSQEFLEKNIWKNPIKKNFLYIKIYVYN